MGMVFIVKAKYIHKKLSDEKIMLDFYLLLLLYCCNS